MPTFAHQFHNNGQGSIREVRFLLYTFGGQMESATIKASNNHNKEKIVSL